MYVITHPRFTPFLISNHWEKWPFHNTWACCDV